jgi:DNA-binding NtrC family response regulator
LLDSKIPEMQILLVDPDETFGHILKDILGVGYKLRSVPTAEAGIRQFDDADPDVVLLNLDQPNGNPDPNVRALLGAACERPIALPIVVYSWDTSRKTLMEIMRQGDVDFLCQPLDIQELKFALDRAYRRNCLMRYLAAQQKAVHCGHVNGLLGNSKVMERVNEIIHKVAGVQTTVLVTGESGTGKEVAARSIHRLSPRADKPFVAFSPCALPESLIEDELFGHEKGSFTGATQIRRGRFEEAKGGTIFIDEIGDLSLQSQAKLLRVLQERTLERLGSNVSLPLDVRVICATSRDLEKMVRGGTFREDLFFRISVVGIHMPPLRERGQDIPLLAEYFLQQFSEAHFKKPRGLTPGFLAALARHNWPGNVRELQNVIERSLVLADDKRQLGVADLPPELRGMMVSDEVPAGSFHEAVRGFKRELIRSALRLHSGNKLRAAQELRISRCYFHRLLSQLDITDAVKSDEGEKGILGPEDLDPFFSAKGSKPVTRIQ